MAGTEPERSLQSTAHKHATIDLTASRYELSLSQRRRLKDELREIPGEIRNGLRMVELSGMDTRSDLGRQLEQQVFDQVFGHNVRHSPAFMEAEYGPYEEQSIFFMAVEEQSLEVLGVLRVITGMPNKTIDDLRRDGLLTEIPPQYDLNPARTWDLGTLAVSPIARLGDDRSLVATSLYRALLRRAIEVGITSWTMIIERGVLDLMHLLGGPFERFADLPDMSYLGSNAQAAFAHVPDIRPSMIKQAECVDHFVRQRIEALLYGDPSIPELAGIVPDRSSLLHTA